MAYLKRVLDGDSWLYKNRVFGLYINKYQCRNEISLIGVGGNVGDSRRVFYKLLIKLKRDNLVNVIAIAPLYKNPPFGYLEQPYFFNTIFLISTKLKPLSLLKYLQHLESYFRRKRLFKDGPRTLDLDILLYNKIKFKKGSKLIIPHPYWQSRKSVLVPLQFIKDCLCLKRVLSHQHLKMLMS